MRSAATHFRAQVRHVQVALVALALVLKVLLPPGFMVGERTNDLPIPIVLCTGAGSVEVHPGGLIAAEDGESAPETKAHDAPCVFAGAALNAPPAIFPTIVPQSGFDVLIGLPGTSRHVAPGRGLSGPPLPARGPPSLMI